MLSKTFERIARQAPFHDEGHGYDIFGLEPPNLARVVELTRGIHDTYFRVDSRGIEHIPPVGPTIVVANHGGILPVDAAMLCMDILLRSTPPRIPRAIADRFVPRFPLISSLFARYGVVNGTRPNVRKLLARGELIALWPEGVTGPAKRFRDRYLIQTWRVGFAEYALRHRATIVPAAVVGAEESWPVLAKLRRLRIFGAPYLPVPAWPVPLPTHYLIRYGEPIVPRFGQEAADDPSKVLSVATDVRIAVEMLLERTLMERMGVFR